MTAQDHIKLVGILHIIHSFPGMILAGLLFAIIRRGSISAAMVTLASEDADPLLLLDLSAPPPS